MSVILFSSHCVYMLAFAYTRSIYVIYKISGTDCSWLQAHCKHLLEIKFDPSFNSLRVLFYV